MLRSRTFREGSVGLLAILGLILFGSVVFWLRGGNFNQGGYEIIARFEDVTGLKVGGPVRYRGVEIGRVRAIIPTANGVEVFITIASKNVRIPKAVEVRTSQFGLIGDAAVDIIPQAEIPAGAESLTALAPDCREAQQILCDRDQLQGIETTELYTSLARLGETFGDPALLQNIDQSIENLATLSTELIALTQSAQSELKSFSKASRAVKTAAENSSQLVATINTLVQDHRNNIIATLSSLQQTSEEVQRLAISVKATSDRTNQALDSEQTQQMLTNVTAVTENAVMITTELHQLSQSLNDPTNLIILQETLDSARATFQNAQKITAEVEEFTGDPDFRRNLKKLVNGLSQLVSTTEQFQQQVHLVQLLEPAAQHLSQSTSTAISPSTPSTLLLTNPERAPISPSTPTADPPNTLSSIPVSPAIDAVSHPSADNLN